MYLGERRKILNYATIPNISLTDSSLTFATVGDGSSSFRSRVHYTKLSSTRERRRSYPHDNSRDSSSSHIWWRLSLTDSSLTFATVGDGSSSFRSRVHYTKLCLAHGNEGEATPTTTVRILRPLKNCGDSTDLKSTRGLIL